MANTPASMSERARKPRIAAPLREVIRLRVREAKPWHVAAEQAGMSEAGVHKARKRPEVQALIEREQQAYVTELEALKAPHKARALEVARDLMDNSKSDSVRMRAVEFFRDEGPKTPQVAVNIQQNIGVKGYEYAPPGARIVDVTPEPEPDQD